MRAALLVVVALLAACGDSFVSPEVVKRANTLCGDVGVTKVRVHTVYGRTYVVQAWCNNNVELRFRVEGQP